MPSDTRPYTPAIRPPAPSPIVHQDALIVTFQLEHQRYGLALDVVREIIRLPALTMLAGAPPALCGLLNLRGQHLPVLDGRVLVGECRQYNLSSQIVIAGQARAELGLLVDQVDEVCAVAADRITPINRTDIAPFLTKVFVLADMSVLLFDLTKLVALTSDTAKRKSKHESQRREPQI
jgi:chemotaxis signal transduction protein